MSVKVGFEVSEEEFSKLKDVKGANTWRVFFLTKVGFPAERQKPGPKGEG